MAAGSDHIPGCIDESRTYRTPDAPYQFFGEFDLTPLSPMEWSKDRVSSRDFYAG